MINRVDEYIPDLLVCKQDLELIDTIGEGMHPEAAYKCNICIEIFKDKWQLIWLA